MRDKHIAVYLKGTPKLGDYLEEGLAQLGLLARGLREEPPLTPGVLPG